MSPEARDNIIAENRILTELETCEGWGIFMEYIADKKAAAERGNENLDATMQERDSFLREKLRLREISTWIKSRLEKNSAAIKG